MSTAIAIVDVVLAYAKRVASVVFCFVVVVVFLLFFRFSLRHTSRC